MTELQRHRLYQEFDDRTTPNWLQDLVNRITNLQRYMIPRWVNVSELPPIWIDSFALNRTQVESVIVALEGSTLEHCHPLVPGLLAYAKRESLDAFVCKLFDLWRSGGKSIQDKWAILAMGLFGSDLAAHKLGPMVYTWRNELKHQHVTWGLECLKAIGTPAALMELHAIAQKTRHKALKERVQSFLFDVAYKLNLTQEDLQDRIIPDCGLDDRGSHCFDFGTRQFELVLSNELKPMVRDATGKLKADLPKPGAKDQPDLANQAIAEWKLIKKQIAQVAKIQSLRLEQAMINGRRWQFNLLETLFVQHPLMTHLAQRLIWGIYDASGQLIDTFRVTEDRAYATIEDKDFVIEASASVGIIHPLELTVEERSTWEEVLNDYEIIQPFAQIHRPLYTLQPEEAAQTAITHFANIQFIKVEVEAIALVGFLDRRGWTRGSNGADLYEHYKTFERANLTAVIQYEQVAAYALTYTYPISVQKCLFLRTNRYVQGNIDHNTALLLSKVDPIIISEVLGDLMTIAAKAQ
jgi:hypothetical protein